MAFLVLAQGGINLWVANKAEQQVVRGRVAGDLQAGFLELSATKQRLRAWSLRALIGADHEPDDGEVLRKRMAATIKQLQDLSVRANRLDDAAGDSSNDNERRDEALKLLTTGVVSLEAPIKGINAQGASTNALTAWSAIETVFDRGAGRDLREVLNDSIRTETELLTRKRADTDRALAGLKVLSTVMTILLSLSALGLAVYFSRALRRPLAEMMQGARAFEEGDLTHRIPVDGSDEFGRFATSINRMALELGERRDLEAQLRAELEVLVAERTTELEAALAGLKQGEHRRRQLLGDISHELRTPMTAIRGEAEIALRGRKTEEDYRNAWTRVGQASQQMGALIDDLIMMARSDSDALVLDLQMLDARMPLEDTLINATSIAVQRQIKLETQIDDREAIVSCDPVRLQQIFTLLLDNAIRYSRPGGTVRVAASLLSDAGHAPSWRLTIADDGIGIPPDELAMVFDRTYRASNARGHRPDGTGLGLAIARTLAERQDGRIDLTSELGRGSTVTFTLPLVTRTSPKRRDAERAA